MQPPKIEFPCADYPIKVLGENSDEFRGFVAKTMHDFFPDLEENKNRSRSSGKGGFQSLTFFVIAKSEQQLIDLNTALRKHQTVKTVL